MMKEMYTTPEVKLVCFEASEKLAAVIDFDDLIELGGENQGGVGDAVIPSGNDINIGA